MLTGGALAVEARLRSQVSRRHQILQMSEDAAQVCVCVCVCEVSKRHQILQMSEDAAQVRARAHTHTHTADV